MLAVAASLLLSACAATTGNPDQGAATADSGRQCFWPSAVTGFSHATRDQFRVHTGARTVYLFQTFGDCPEIQDTESLAFDVRGGGMICDGRDVTLIVPSSIGPHRCAVRMIRRLSDEEAHAPR